MHNALIILLENYSKRLFLKNTDANWIEVLPGITKKYNIRRRSSTKLTPVQASLKKNEGFLYNNLIDKRKKIKPNFLVDDLVRIADLKKTFSKSDTTNWFYKLYTIAEIINDTIPS